VRGPIKSAACAAALEVETDRLRIRLLAPPDENLYCMLYTDPDTMRFIGPPLTFAHAQKSFRAAIRLLDRTAAKQIVLAIEERSSSQAIGICGLHHIDMQRGVAEAGIILHPAARARGYSREGLAALVDRAFERLPIDEVWVQISVDYAIVERLVISVGFKRAPERAQAGGPAWQVWRIDRASRTSAMRFQ
jgi:RimJ/RimL family protein N-acetyltransferase